MSGPLTADVARGSIWIALARLSVNVLGFVGLVALARLLTPEDFGLVAIATTLLAIVTAATNLSIGNALVQHRAPTEEHFGTAFTLNLIRGVLVLVGFGLAAYPAMIAFNEPRLLLLMPVMGVGALVVGLQNPRLVMFMRDLVFWQQFVLQVSEKIVVVLVSVGIALSLGSYWALVLGLVAGQLSTLAVSYILLPYRPRLTLSRFNELFSFSVWLTLSQIINVINWRFDQLMIGRYLGREALGHYSVGDNLASMPTREVTAPLFATLFPTFARMAEAPERLRNAYQRAQAVIVALALPTGVGVALVADPIVRLAMGEAWLASVFVIQGLAAIFALQTIGSLADPLAMAKGQTRILFFRDMQGFAIRLPIIITGMVLGGVAGVVYGRMISGTIGIAQNMVIVRKIAGIPIRAQLLAPLRSLLSVAVMAVAVMSIERIGPWDHSHATLLIEILVKAGLGAVTYAATHLALWNASGRPLGPETEMMSVAKATMRRFLPGRPLTDP